MSESCDCLTCALRQVLADRYPEGAKGDELSDGLIALASLSGAVLAVGTDAGLNAYVEMLSLARTRSRGQAGAADTKGMH